MLSAASQERTQADVKKALESITRTIDALRPAVQNCKLKEDQEADPKSSEEYQLLSTVLHEIRRLEPKLFPAHYDLLVKIWNTIKGDDNSEQFPVFKPERVREILYGTKKENKIIKPPALMKQKETDETFQSLWDELKEATK